MYYRLHTLSLIHIFFVAEEKENAAKSANNPLAAVLGAVNTTKQIPPTLTFNADNEMVQTLSLIHIYTIFVLEGDHGKLVGDAECELPESYNHIPLMIYSSRIQPEEKTTFGGQVDIQPTILGLLNIGI